MEEFLKYFPKEFLQGLSTLGVVLMAIVGTAYSVLGFLGKTSVSEFIARNKIRRDFADATGKKIAELANQHYWAIANAAGTLSVGLRDYLEALEVRLYLRWDSSLEPNLELRAVADEAAQVTYPSLVSLVWALHNFQFVGSNDYLLPNYSAGRHLRRLYNSFRESLVSAKASSDSADLVTVLLQNGVYRDGKFDLDATLNELSKPDQAALRAQWTDWLRGNLPDVLTATSALEAFSRLLQHEIAELHEDWFRDRKAAGDLDVVHSAVTRGKWMQTLTNTELATVAIAREQADFMMALRRTGAPLRAKPAETIGRKPSDVAPIDIALDSAAASKQTRSVQGADIAVDPTAQRFVEPSS